MQVLDKRKGQGKISNNYIDAARPGLCRYSDGFFREYMESLNPTGSSNLSPWENFRLDEAQHAANNKEFVITDKENSN